MSKRKQRREQGASWAEESSEREAQSLQEITAQGYGLNIAPTQQRIVAKPVSIFDIYPDPAQPRRTIPSRIRKAWNGDPTKVKELLMVWWGEVQRERGASVGAEEVPFDLGAYLSSGKTERAATEDGDYTPGPLEESLMRITVLAASIRRDGLTNPVTAVQVSNHNYRLETGERRWMAYHLLHAWFDGHDGRPDESELWGMIPARMVERVDVWRQASENNARDNLNAIGKARQYAVLMMDLHGMEHFRPIETFTSEQHYYAQASGLDTPYGKREQLLNALGVSSPSVLTRLRHLLQLPDEIWRGGDDHSLSEELLENLHQLAKKDISKAIEKFRKIVYNKNMDQPGGTIKRAPEAVTTPGTKRHFSVMLRYMNRAGKGKKEANEKALESLQEMRQWLEEQEARLRSFIS